MTPAPSLDQVLSSIRFNPDLVLWGLIQACQQGYPLAGRVVLQAMLPKLVLLSRTYPYPEVDHLLAALWIRLANYPLERRPHSVAANLYLDTRKDVLSEARAQPLAPPTTTDPGPSGARVILTARQLKLASPLSLTIVEEVYLKGLPQAVVAERYAMSRGAIRRRCSDTVRQLRDHRELLIAYCSDPNGPHCLVEAD
jgi:hypothetical protein